MTNFEHYKTLENARDAHKTLFGKGYPYKIRGCRGTEGEILDHFTKWLYAEHFSLKECAKKLVFEINGMGMTCDTMASDILYSFIRELEFSGSPNDMMDAARIVTLDNKGAGRNRAMTYALLVIGKKYGTEIFYN